VILKSFVILFLLVAFVIGAACQTPTPTPTLTPNLPTSAPIVTPTPVTTATPSSTSTELDPSQFLPLLRQVSEPFDNFYGNEIEPLNAEIHWFYNPSLGGGAVTTPFSNYKSYKIELSHIPNRDQGNASLQKDAFIIAHELATIVVVPTLAKGWKLQCSVIYIYFDMFDMISTPLRNHILAKYNFDVLGDFQYYLQAFLTSENCPQPTYPLNVHDLAFYYVWFVLYWQYALDNPSVPSDLDNWFQSCAPDARQEGLNILSMVDNIGGLGNITVDNAKALFRQIIADDSLNCQVIEIK